NSSRWHPRLPNRFPLRLIWNCRRYATCPSAKGSTSRSSFCRTDRGPVAVKSQDGEANSRGQIGRVACFIDLPHQTGKAEAAFSRHRLETKPEFGFERDGSAVAGDGERPLFHAA